MNNDTSLLRQVHPSWIVDERPTTLLFKPCKKQDFKISVYDGDQISAKDSFEHYTKTIHNQSCGVMSVMVSDCYHFNLGVISDPQDNYPQHTLIDFRKLLTNSEKEKIGAKLREIALQKGWSYQPTSAEY